MEIIIDFPGGKRVDAHLGEHTVHTDQPVANGGENFAPSPFDIFLAAIGTCAGFYVLDYCKHHDLSSEGICIIERIERDPFSRMVTKIDIEIQTPSSFPEKYLPSLIRSAELCAVKKHLENPPKFDVTTKVV
jgi:putative redox protein